ncbi:MAG: mannose-6-phosphate isomerase, class I [Spirochaetae bacterium HGW-Spirochaetae-7]|jgi:mannose-6-phosphate isomerase|nr:MAG: mannose-6-phosphate isomerase, class I [Spirochaetae bacterium HGW-Spirochaetae-7]
MAIFALENRLQKYDWGSAEYLPEFLGRDNPSGEPWAEMWMGAHPKAPSIAIDPLTGTRVALDALVAANPASVLGKSTVDRFDGKLPFLFKVLSIAKPLSIQAHPTKRKAEHGFAGEEFASIPIDSPDRNYKDRNHKPETVVALGPFQGLCGFRPIAEIVRNIQTLSPEDWPKLVRRLAADPGMLELSVFFYTFVSLTGDSKTRTLTYTRRRSERIVAAEPAGSATARIFTCVLELMDVYPDDVGALAPLVLNLFELAPGQALNIAAGQAHAYLHGNAVEIMANSDNVLRGGLTHKHIDIPELISLLSFESAAFTPTPMASTVNGFGTYDCGVPDYAIARATVHGTMKAGRRAHVPEILLCTAGSLSVSPGKGLPLPLSKGSSVFVTADHGPYSLSGDGELFRASMPT